MSENNPLTSFFRKSKLSLQLPSKGRWYPHESLILDNNGGVEVFAMTASDDIKFRTGDITQSGKSTYDLIRSCLPGILNPGIIPSVDIDHIWLAIRLASYGPEFEFKVTVPGTNLTRTVKLDIKNLLTEKFSENWDNELSIEDENGQKLTINITPITLENLFSTNKNITRQKKVLNKSFDQDENIIDDNSFLNTVNELTNTAIELLCSSIQTLSFEDADGKGFTLDASNPQERKQIDNTIQNLDVEYFNAIRDHLEKQRKKFTLLTPIQASTKEEIAAGAELCWQAEIIFAGSNFLPNAKTNI